MATEQSGLEARKTSWEIHWHTLWRATPCASLCPSCLCQAVPTLTKGREGRHPSWKGPAWKGPVFPPVRAGDSGGSLRATCSCEQEVTCPGSAQQLQATALSEKCSCLYSCSLFHLFETCHSRCTSPVQQILRFICSWHQ